MAEERFSLPRSFAFRLGIAFAVVAIAGATVTVLVVNAAFADRFDRYLHQQQAAQVARISAAVSRAYAGGGKWDQYALEALPPMMGSGAVRVDTPNGQKIWQWDGHSTSWNDRWMDGSSGNGGTGQSQSGGRNGNGGTGQSQNGNGMQQGGTSSHGSSGSRWGLNGQGSHDQGWSRSMPEGNRVSVVLLAATPSATAPTTAASTPTLGPAQRIVIRSNGKVVGTALVRLPQPTALPEAVAFRAEAIRLVVISGVIGALLSLGLGILFARRATRPVRQVTGAAQALASGDRTVRLDAERPDEFGEMGRAFNAMADAVDGEERLRQGFAAEVAHELRTPLTILRSQVEGLRIGVLEPTPEALGSLDEEVQRMTRLVADLQILGSADAAGFSLERTSVDLRELIDASVRAFAGLFEGSEVGVETRLEPAAAWVDRVRVGQVMANLLSNALKFTPPGGQVRVELRPDGPWAMIRVSDSGPGIPADELPHLFDRFFRGRTARPSGSGIGLTVVRELVEAHGGTVEVSSEAGQGASFVVLLPSIATYHGRGTAPAPSTHLVAATG